MYNGYSNYETWCVMLWFGNNGLVDQFQSWQGSDKDLALHIQSLLQDDNPLKDTTSMYADMMGAALSNVDYLEVARSILSD